MFSNIISILFLVLVHAYTRQHYIDTMDVRDTIHTLCALFKIYKKRTVICVLGLFRKIYPFFVHLTPEPLLTEWKSVNIVYGIIHLTSVTLYAPTKYTRPIQTENRIGNIFCSSFFCIYAYENSTHNPTRNPRFSDSNTYLRM